MMGAYGCFVDESGGVAARGDVVPVGMVPPGWSFCRVTDGWNAEYGYQEYCPRQTYLRRQDGLLRACVEFGGVWTLADCGLTEDTPVRLQTWHGRWGQ